MSYRLRDTVSLKSVIDRMLEKTPALVETVTQDDVKDAVGEREYFFRDEIDTIENAIWAQSYLRLSDQREAAQLEAEHTEEDELA